MDLTSMILDSNALKYAGFQPKIIELSSDVAAGRHRRETWAGPQRVDL